MVGKTVLVVMLMLPSMAIADDLEVDLSASAEYDSNVFRLSSNEEDDVVFRLIPGATLSRRDGRFRYRLNYQMPFEQGVEFGDDISNFDQILFLNTTYLPNDANEITFDNFFRYDRSLTRRFATEDNVQDVNSERARILSNTATLDWTHAFSSRTRSGLELSNNIFNTDFEGRQDVQTLAATGDLRHDLTSRSQVGGGLSFTLQNFSEGSGIPSSQTFFYNFFLSLTHQFDETTTLSIAGGPTLVQGEEDDPASSLSTLSVPVANVNGVARAFDINTCGVVNGQIVFSGCSPSQTLAPPAPGMNPTVTSQFVSTPPGQSELNLTAFGNVSLTKRWSPAVSSSLSYRRQQSNASGLGGSTILDSVYLLTEWQIDQWWDVSVRGDFLHRESTSESTQTFLVVQDDGGGRVLVPGGVGGLISQRVNNSIETNNYGVSGRLARQIGRNAEATLRLTYSVQDSAAASRGSISDFDVFLAIFGVRYRFDPLTVW